MFRHSDHLTSEEFQAFCDDIRREGPSILVITLLVLALVRWLSGDN